MPPPARPPLKVVLKDLFGYEHTIFGPNDAIIFSTSQQVMMNLKIKKKEKNSFVFVDPGLEPGTNWMTLAL